MKITEIELIPPQNFPAKKVEMWLEKSTPRGMLGNFVVNYIEFRDQRGVVLTDANGVIAAYAGFIVRLNGKIWQAYNAQSYEPYKNQTLVGKIYQMIKQDWHQSIQSDTAQTVDGMRLWTKTLPSLGLKPMIFDTETDRIIDPAENIIDMYPKDAGISKKWRYAWILESSDCYPNQNLLKEGSLLMPYQNLWYKGSSS
jgi:hypothetical protein